jgi:hypothetical protein
MCPAAIVRLRVKQRLQAIEDRLAVATREKARA